MAGVNTDPVWENEVTQIEDPDYVDGGEYLPGGEAGKANMQAYQLARRTQYLKEGKNLAAAPAGTPGASALFTFFETILKSISLSDLENLLADAFSANLTELEAGSLTRKFPSPSVLRTWATKRVKLPDGATAVYAQDAFATADSWGGVNSVVDVSTESGWLRATWNGVGGYFQFHRTISGIGGKIAILRLKASATKRYQIMVDVGTNVVLSQPTLSLNPSVHVVLLPLNTIGVKVVTLDAPSSGEWIAMDWFWVGDYSYLPGSLSEEAARINNQLGDTTGVGVAASGTISLGAGGNYVAGETITIGGFVYTFRALVSELTAPGDVLIGAALGNSHENLSRAISRVSPSLYDASSGGTDPRYYTPAAYIHPLVSALMSGAIVNLTAILPGDFGNKIALSTSAPTKCIFSASTLTGGYSDFAAKASKAVAAASQGLDAKTSFVDADEILVLDSTSGKLKKRLTMANFKATLLAADGNTDAGKAVQANDSRLPIVGTFTPTVVASGGGEATYTTQYGQFVKIGKLVHVDINLAFSKNTLSGYVYIAGLPYNAKSATLYRASATISYHQGINVNANYQNIGGYIRFGASNITLVQNSFTNNAALITDTNLSASSVLIVSADYVID